MAVAAGAVKSINPSSSWLQLDAIGATMQGNLEEGDPTVLFPNQLDDISHLALDIGGRSNIFFCFDF